MSDAEVWQEQNARYLSTAMEWLRARLRKHAGQGQVPLALIAAPEPAAQESKSRWRQIMGRAPAQLPPMPHAPHQSSQYVSSTEATAGSDDVHAGTSFASLEPNTDPPPALILLGRQLGLSHFEQQILLLCAAMELDTSIAALCARAQNDQTRAYPTFALAMAVLDEPAWEALSPERPLRYWRLIEINQPGAQPLTASALRADERIVNFLKGLNYLDDRLAPLLSTLDLSDDESNAPASQHDAADKIVSQLRLAASTQELPVVQLLGNDGPSKRVVAGLAAASLGLRTYVLPAGLLSSQPGEIESLARLWQRESLILPVALYIDTSTTEGEQTSAAAVNRFLRRIHGIVFLDTRETWADLGKAVVLADIAKPTAAEQQAVWTEALGQSAGENPALLAGQFNLAAATIREIAREALAESPGGSAAAVEDRIWAGCLSATRPRLDAMAARIQALATWDDIVLPPTETSLLHQIADQVAQRTTVYQTWGFGNKLSRGLGISALFAGPSGTGKTMAAEVLANYLKLNLYRIDLSAVVSKYIGETEKNLRRLFDAAEDGGAILFFDEADALFGKRSEVKDSHDRYANIEINYLLQRMEAYRGLAILATNLKSSMDAAFVRRLRFIVNFPFPGTVERQAIWQKVFPAQTPVQDLDFEWLGKFNLTGGSIQNIAINAAFLAARAGTSVTMDIVLESTRAEFRKLERPANEADFRKIAAVRKT